MYDLLGEIPKCGGCHDKTTCVGALYQRAVDLQAALRALTAAPVEMYYPNIKTMSDPITADELEQMKSESLNLRNSGKGKTDREYYDWIRRFEMACARAASIIRGLTAAPPTEGAIPRKPYWLIERGQQEGQIPTIWVTGDDWRTGMPYLGKWTETAAKAMRFPLWSKGDEFAQANSIANYRVTGHLDLDAAPKVTEGAAMEALQAAVNEIVACEDAYTINNGPIVDWDALAARSKRAMLNLRALASPIAPPTEQKP